MMDQRAKYSDRAPVRSVEKEDRFSVLGTELGASAPTLSSRAIGASGSVKVPIYSFSKTTEQEVYLEWHVPEEIDDFYPVEFHVMWQPASGWSTGNFMWKLEYLVKDEGDSVATIDPTTIQQSVTPGIDLVMIETEFSDTITVTTEQMVMARFYRDVANDNGDVAGEVRFFEFQYNAFPLGRHAHPSERLGA